eukprot:g43105.t1
MQQASIAVKQTGRSVQQASIAVKQTGRSVQQVSIAMKQTGRGLQQVSIDVKETGRSVQQVSIAMKQTRRSLQQFSITVKQTGRSLHQVGITVKQTRRSMQKVSIAMKQTGTSVQQLYYVGAGGPGAIHSDYICRTYWLLKELRLRVDDQAVDTVPHQRGEIYLDIMVQQIVTNTLDELYIRCVISGRRMPINLLPCLKNHEALVQKCPRPESGNSHKPRAITGQTGHFVQDCRAPKIPTWQQKDQEDGFSNKLKDKLKMDNLAHKSTAHTQLGNQSYMKHSRAYFHGKVHSSEYK